MSIKITIKDIDSNTNIYKGIHEDLEEMNTAIKKIKIKYD